MQPIILIAWNTLTTGWDSYVDTFTTNETMTYLDLLTELQSFDDDSLLKEVSVYDTYREEFAPVGVLLTDADDEPYLEI